MSSMQPVRACPSTLAAIPIRGEILSRTFRVRAAIHRAEEAGDRARADAGRLVLLTLGSLLGELNEALERHRDLHPFEEESGAALARIRAALGAAATADARPAP